MMNLRETSMQRTTRRTLLQRGAAVGLSAVAYTRIARAAAGNDRPKIGFIGCGGRSKSLVRGFLDDADLAWACDPDQRRLASFQKSFGARHATGDLRRVLDDPAVDAVVVATPDHWHAPAAIMACDAGKHVYVETRSSSNTAHKVAPTR